MSDRKSNGTGPPNGSRSSNSIGNGNSAPNSTAAGSLNCAEFFRNPYGMFEDEDTSAIGL